MGAARLPSVESDPPEYMQRTIPSAAIPAVLLMLLLSGCGEPAQQTTLTNLGDGLAIDVEGKLYDRGERALVDAFCAEKERDVSYGCDVYVSNGETPNRALHVVYDVELNSTPYRTDDGHLHEKWVATADPAGGLPKTIVFDPV